MRDDGGGLQGLSELMYADQPDHVRSAGGPWAGVARAVERAMAVLEDGQRKLAEIWRSPAGTAYLAEMSRVVEAMRATSETARHNDQVMSAAADALDGKQKDFAVLTTAPVPEDARERYARAIVDALDESYQQAVASFREVPVPGSHIDQSEPLTPDRLAGMPSMKDAGSASARVSSQPADGQARSLPSWVPDQPGQRGATGPMLAATSSPTSTGAPSDSWQAHGATGSASTGVESLVATGSGPSSMWSAASRQGASGYQHRPTVPARPTAERHEYVPRRSAPSHGAGSQAEEIRESRPRAARTGAQGAREPGSLVSGGAVTGSAGVAGRHWQGYRRPPEPFPTSQRHAVPSVIGASPSSDPEPIQVSTDYIDESGNRITIRRPRE